jgi:hypothetical protein
MCDEFMILCECGYVKLNTTVVCDICFNIAIECDLIWDDD